MNKFINSQRDAVLNELKTLNSYSKYVYDSYLEASRENNEGNYLFWLTKYCEVEKKKKLISAFLWSIDQFINANESAEQ